MRGKAISMAVSLLDGAGKAVVGQRIRLSSKLGNPIPATVTTDTNGQANISFTASVAGTDTITASALGGALTQDVVVSAVDFAFVSPAADALLTISNCHPVSVQLNGVSATSAVFSTSRGQVFATSACSAGSDLQTIPFSGGRATAYVKSTSAGAATVLAELSGSGSAGRTSLPVNFVATVPQTVIVQSDPSVVAVNGSSAITALVKDVDGNPVAGKTVFFTASGGGVPSPTTAITNDAGVASTTFKADASISGKDSVVITASVAGVVTSGTTTLTVAGKAVNIVIGTDNLIVDVSGPPRFRKVWGVLVSDPASGPIRNQVVTISLRGMLGRSRASDIAVVRAEADATRAEAEAKRAGLSREADAQQAETEALARAAASIDDARASRAEASLGKLAEEVEKGRLQAREAFVAQDALTEMLGQRIAAKREACLASVKLAALRGAPLDRGAR